MPNFTQGTCTFSSATANLSDFDPDSHTSEGSESVTVVTGGANPFGSGSCFKWDISTSVMNEIDVIKHLSGANTRDCKFKFLLDASATLKGEETIFHVWRVTETGHYVDVIQIRITDAGNGKFHFLLRAPEGPEFPRQKRSRLAYSKNTSYLVELYMTDNSFNLLVNGQIIIEWYNGSYKKDSKDFYYAFDNAGFYMDVVAIGKFYSQQLSGSFYIKDISFFQDYIAPPFPSTADEQLADCWDAWKKRYLRSDGAVVRPYPDGKDQGLSDNPWSDVVSEGIAYGMMLAVQFNDQATFDSIYHWAQTNLHRSKNGMSAGHLMGWHWDDVGNTMYDWNIASDADIDAALALVWATQRKANGDPGWASSSINYEIEAKNIIDDLKNHSFRTDFVNGTEYAIQTSDLYQTSDIIEVNTSYLSPAAYKAFRAFTGDPFWDQAIEGAYQVLKLEQTASMTDKSLNGQYMKGSLPCDWVGYDLKNHRLADSPPGDREIKYTYDAFRTIARVYWHYYWYADGEAKKYLTGPLWEFFKEQWESNGAIWAQYYHNGTVIGTPYEKSMMTFMAYWCGVTNSPTDPTAKDIYDKKLANLYAQSYVGGFYRDNPTTTGLFVGAPGYFNDCWMLLHELVYNNKFTNLLPQLHLVP